MCNAQSNKEKAEQYAQNIVNEITRIVDYVDTPPTQQSGQQANALPKMKQTCACEPVQLTSKADDAEAQLQLTLGISKKVWAMKKSGIECSNKNSFLERQLS